MKIARLFAVCFPISTLCHLAGCADSCTESWPAASGSAKYVSSACGSASGDGTQAAPYATPAQAAAAAKAGDTVVLAGGSYGGSFTLPAGVHVVGPGATQVFLDAGGASGITVKGSGKSTIRGVAVKGATGYGIAAAGASLVLSDVAVSGTQPTKDGAGGHGVQAEGGAELVLESARIQNNIGTGVLAVGVAAVSIVDPAFKPGASDGGAAIVDPAFAPASVIANNQGGGVAIVDPAFAPGSNDAPKLPVQIAATDIRKNSNFGLALFGGGASISRSAIRDTAKTATGDFADGVVVAASTKTKAGALVVDAQSAVTGNGRAGLIAATQAQVSIEGELSGNETGGAWIQGTGAVLQLGAKARLRNNGLLGAGAAKGGRIEVSGARIEGTQARKFAEPAGGMLEDVGDGLGAFHGSSLKVQGARFANNARAGVVAHQPKAASGALGIDIAVAGSEFEGGQFGIVVNKAGLAKLPDAGGLKGDNKFSAVKTAIDNAGNLTVRSTVCTNQQQDAEACSPKQSALSAK
ncbi:MAG: hypothetical protein FJ100_01650 [Deltaproteobacteria bacterium]|nr:hypothetical protein [Deltaproteobacteria bacterium]